MTSNSSEILLESILCFEWFYIEYFALITHLISVRSFLDSLNIFFKNSEMGLLASIAGL